MKVSPMRYESKFFWILISVLVYCLKILGLAPFSLRRKKSLKNSTRNYTMVFLFSKIGLAYSILLSILVLVIAGLLFPRLLSLKYNHESSVTQASDVFQGILCLFTVWIILTAWTFNQRKAASIMNRIFAIDEKLCGRGKQPLNKPSFVFITTHVMLNVFLWGTILVTESLELVISDAVVNWFFFTLPSFVIHWFVVEYFMVVGLVARKLEIININLTNFNKLRNYLFRTSFSDEHPTGRNLSIHSQLEALNLLHNIRTEIFDISQDIEEFFSLPILACVSYSFFGLVYNVYYLITLAVLQIDDFSITSITSTVVWILLSLYPFGFLFFNVTETVTEAKLTGRLVHKLLSLALREEIKEELELFSLQLLHENMDFTAYGFFTLDFTLLHSMLGATATYLVILVQFQQ